MGSEMASDSRTSARRPNALLERIRSPQPSGYVAAGRDEIRFAS